jgi:hypothetical protein
MCMCINTCIHPSIHTYACIYKHRFAGGTAGNNKQLWQSRAGKSTSDQPENIIVKKIRAGGSSRALSMLQTAASSTIDNQTQSIRGYGPLPVDNCVPDSSTTADLQLSVIENVAQTTLGPFSRDLFEFLIPNFVLAPYPEDKDGVVRTKLQTASATKAYKHPASRKHLHNAGLVMSWSQCATLQSLWNEPEWQDLFMTGTCVEGSLRSLCRNKGSCLRGLYEVIYIFTSKPWSKW